MPLVSVFDIVPLKPRSEPKAAIVPMRSERIECRSNTVADLTRSTEFPQRDAIRRLWVLSKCRACGQCADMVAI